MLHCLGNNKRFCLYWSPIYQIYSVKLSSCDYILVKLLFPECPRDADTLFTNRNSMLQEPAAEKVAAAGGSAEKLPAAQDQREGQGSSPFSSTLAEGSDVSAQTIETAAPGALTSSDAEGGRCLISNFIFPVYPSYPWSLKFKIGSACNNGMLLMLSQSMPFVHFLRHHFSDHQDGCSNRQPCSRLLFS
jgi:hypothetical protein